RQDQRHSWRSARSCQGRARPFLRIPRLRGVFVPNPHITTSSTSFYSALRFEKNIFMADAHRNYLHAYRNKIGLTQQEVAWIPGYTTRRRISDLELGCVLPDARECLIFARLFGTSFPELWPNVVAETERDLNRRVGALLADYRGVTSGSYREQQRADV